MRCYCCFFSHLSQLQDLSRLVKQNLLPDLRLFLVSHPWLETHPCLRECDWRSTGVWDSNVRPGGGGWLPFRSMSWGDNGRDVNGFVTWRPATAASWKCHLRCEGSLPSTVGSRAATRWLLGPASPGEQRDQEKRVWPLTSTAVTIVIVSLSVLVIITRKQNCNGLDIDWWQY